MKAHLEQMRGSHTKVRHEIDNILLTRDIK